MPEEKKEVQKEQMVDLDTSGPEVDIALPEEKETISRTGGHKCRN